jgi:hypothetical protein
MQEDALPQAYRRAAALLFYLVLALPGTAVTALDYASRPSDPVQRALAILGVGIGGYAALFLLLVFAVPGLLKRSGRTGLALHWRCAAFHASIWSSILTVSWTIPKVPGGPLNARLAVALVAASVDFWALAWAKRRYFDGPCSQLRGWPKW